MSTNPSHYYQRQMEEKVAEARHAIDHVANTHTLAPLPEPTMLEQNGELIAMILGLVAIGLAGAMVFMGALLGAMS